MRRELTPGRPRDRTNPNHIASRSAKARRRVLPALLGAALGLALGACASSPPGNGNDGDAAVQLLENGQPCTDAAECESGHCQNGYCCASGDCCNQPLNCPGTYTEPATCDNEAACQGHRSQALCVEFTCDSSRIDDDSACGESTFALDCNPYAPIYCTGDGDQDEPACPDACVDDDECADGYHCDDTCEEDLADGSECDENSDCESGYCSNGYCCQSGDCCAAETDCPAVYTQAPRCDNTTTCQGTRRDPVCDNYMCDSSDPIEDDTGCDSSTMSKDCAPYAPVYCNGQSAQQEPECSVSCTQDSDCETDYHCDTTCQPDLANGLSCDENSDCISGHCQNGFCCGSGDCCAGAGDCPASYTTAATCDDPATCQGTRRDAQCTNYTCQPGPQIGDDSACAGQEANTCGFYPSVYCTNSQNQSPPVCSTSCGGDGDCDADAHCDGGICVQDLPQGMACDEPSDCQTGLYCVDGYCCDGPCSGTCVACNVSGHQGTCTNIPGGQDPDGECGAISCTGYFDGWQGDMCYAESDVPSTASSCDGGGSCQTASALCPAQSAGSVTTDCHDVCQTPNSGTCTGTTPGTCTNVSGGTINCGVGACYREVAECSGGSYNTCTPGSPGSESCNNVDDDCNGTVDDNVAGAADQYEPNDSCSGRHDLGIVAEFNSVQSWQATVYPSYDDDYYRFKAEEGTHACGFCWIDQDYRIEVTLTPPTGPDCVDYDLRLYDDSCNLLDSSIAGGCLADTITYDWDGECCFNDSKHFIVRVDPVGSVFECRSYTLSIDMWQI